MGCAVARKSFCYFCYELRYCWLKRLCLFLS
ncbi:hypothetical protein, partial [Snodgrassella communis]